MGRIRAIVLGCLLLGLTVAPSALASGVTNAGDDLRTGWYPNQPTLTPALVSGGTFGQLWSTSVNGQVYAQPLLSNGTVFVATETNHIYGLDPATGAIQWSKALANPWNPADISCGDLTPSIGVTSTPVIDTTTNTAYLTYKTYVSGTSGPAAWYMDAYDVTTGAEKTGFPVALAGTAQNAPGRTFLAANQLQRPGLLLLDGVVYAAFGSHCDHSPWQGWVFGVSTAGQLKARWVDNTTANGAGIWQSGAGLSSDGSGRILLTTGNGGAPTVPTPGNTPPANLGESVVRLQVQADGSLQAVDFFAPFDAASLDSFDADFASGGITGLPDAYFGTAALPHLGVVVGKSGYVYVLNRDSLGGFDQGPSGTEAVVQRLGPRGGVWSRPGVWPGDGGWIYIPTSSGSSGGGLLDVYKYGVDGSGQPSLSLQASSSDVFGWGSGAPVITSDGTTSGSALVWIIWATNRTGAGGQLRAYDPVPVNGHPVLRFSAPIGTASNYSTPGVGAGRLYVGTRDSKVLGFGSPITPPLSGSTLAFPTTTIGSSSQSTLTLTANQTLTISALASSSTQFTLGTPTPVLPATLVAGQTISIPVTFAPTQTGLVGGQVTVTTGGPTTTSFGLSGTGQSSGPLLSVSPRIVSMGGTAVGGHLSGTAVFSNLGSAPLTINSVQLPAAPFSATGVPAVGSTIAAGASVTVNVSFDPTALGTFVDTIGLTTTGGNGSVGLSGMAGTPGTLQITSESNDYGSVPVGTTATKTFTLTNTGGTNITITKSKPPSGGAFAATTTLQEGTTIAPGASVTETVTFTPTGPGYAAGTWQINGDDTTGLHQVQFTGIGTVPAPATGSWTTNGSATLSGSTLSLTGTGTFLAGTSFFKTPLDSHHIVVTFDSTIGGGSGADGLALVFADATRGATAASLGYRGGGLGFSGIPGDAVALDTYKNAVNPSANFVGITDGPTSTSRDLLHWLSTNSGVASLRALHHVKVELLNGTVTVSMDGTLLLTQPVTLGSNVLLGFAGGTGGSTDNHQVTNVVVSGDGPPAGPASLTVSNAVAAPGGSQQLGAQMSFSGSCPSAFTTAALGNGGSESPTLTGAVAGSACSVSEAAPAAAGGTWVTTASVNGGTPVTLTASGGQLTLASFALAAGANTVAFTNTWTPPAPATLTVTNTVAAPGGSGQTGAQMSFSGSCPSAFTTALLGNGGSESPTLTGAVAGSACSVSEAAPAAAGGTWVTTASVNGGTPVTLTAAGGQLTLASFALAAGANTVAFTNTWTPPPPPATLTITNTVAAPAGSPQLGTQMSFSGSCPSAFTTTALGNGGTASPTLTGAVAGSSCTVSETVPAAPTGAKWTVTAQVNGGATQTLTITNATATVPSFAMTAATNTIAFTNTYTPPSSSLIPNPAAGGWKLNGTAVLNGTALQLTNATATFAAGSAFWPTAIDPHGLRIDFDATINGGSGADGLAFIFADATRGATPSSLGYRGGGLGFSGIPGLAIALDTYKNSVNPSANFIGITNGPTTTSRDLLHWLATATLTASLRTATHHITITTTATTITISVDGTQVLTQTLTLPTSTYLGFSGATGGLTDRHAITNLTITPYP